MQVLVLQEGFSSQSMSWDWNSSISELEGIFDILSPCLVSGRIEAKEIQILSQGRSISDLEVIKKQSQISCPQVRILHLFVKMLQRRGTPYSYSLS